MNSIVLMFIGGLKDALNPCALATAATFAVLLFALRESRQLLKTFGSMFVIIYFFTSLALQAGTGNELFTSLRFHATAVLFYLFLATFLIFVGVYFFAQWLKVRKTKTVPQLFKKTITEPTLLRFLGVFFGLLLAIMEFTWPPDMWVIKLANELFLPGKALSGMGYLFWYGFFKLWCILTIALLYFFSRRDGRLFSMFHARPSMFFIVTASFYLGLGAGLASLFSQKI